MSQDPPKLCPKCGYDLAEDELLSLGGWLLAPGEISYKDKAFTFTKQQKEILYTLAKAAPRAVSDDALKNRLGVKNKSHIAVLVSGIKHEVGHIIMPIQRVREYGYRWA